MKITQSGRAAQEGEPGGLADKTTAPEEFALPDEFSPFRRNFRSLPRKPPSCLLNLERRARMCLPGTTAGKG